MGKEIFFIIALFLVSMSFVSADFGYNNPELPNIPSPEITVTTIININNTNSSDYWDDLNYPNATQMEDSGGVLNILETWFSNLFDTLFGAKDTDDLSEGSTNLYDNRSWNETYADGLYGVGNPFDQVLNITSNVTFNDLNITGNVSIGEDLIIDDLTKGSVLFAGDNGIISQDNSGLFWNNTDNRLGVGISTPLHTLDVLGDFLLTHIATSTDEHGLEIVVDASGFGDVKGIDLDYISGAIGVSDNEEAILINIDGSLATGGDIVGVEVLATESSANVFGLEAGVGVSPIIQLSGVFDDMDSVSNDGSDDLADFISSASNVTIFDADNDYVILGNVDVFEEIEFLFDVVSSKNIKPTFEFSLGVGSWASFSPADGTNGMENNGVIAWHMDDTPSWATSGGEYLIRITRTRNNLVTSPIEDRVQISSTTEYLWDEDGDLLIRNLNVSENITADYFFGDISQATGGGSGGIWTNVSGTATYLSHVNISGNLTVLGEGIFAGDMNKTNLLGYTNVRLGAYSSANGWATILMESNNLGNPSIWTIDNGGGGIRIYETTPDAYQYARFRITNTTIIFGEAAFGREIDLDITGDTIARGNVSISEDLIVNNSDLFVDTSEGRVGIGTTSPNFKIEAVDDNSGISFKFENTNVAYASTVPFFLISSPRSIASLGAFGIDDSGGTGTGNLLKVEQDGRVGIGTDDPNSRLNVEDAKSGASVYIKNTNAAYGSGSGILIVEAPRNLASLGLVQFLNSDGVAFDFEQDADAECYGGAGCWAEVSSIQFKDDVKELSKSRYEQMLTDLINTSLYDFTMKNDKIKEVYTGIVTEYSPDYVVQNGGRSTSPTQLAVWALGSIKGLQEIIDFQQMRIEESEIRIELLEAENDLMKISLCKLGETQWC